MCSAVFQQSLGTTGEGEESAVWDNKLFHLGFHVGIHAQDMLLTHTGVSTNGETWFAEIPTYSPGFSVGVIGDMFLNPYFNLRFIPTINLVTSVSCFVNRKPVKSFVHLFDRVT